MSSFAVVLDTCVLLPAALRDTLLRTAAIRLYRPLWSNDILDELRRNLRENRGLADEQADRLIMMMRLSFPEACVDGYHSLISQMTNDSKDRHVLAAAVKAGAQTIVTMNLSDFPKSALAPYDVEAQSPDEFLCNLYDLAPQSVSRIVGEQASDLRKPPMSVDDVVAELAKNAPAFAALLTDRQERPGRHREMTPRP